MAEIIFKMYLPTWEIWSIPQTITAIMHSQGIPQAELAEWDALPLTIVYDWLQRFEEE